MERGWLWMYLGKAFPYCDAGSKEKTKWRSLGKVGPVGQSMWQEDPILGLDYALFCTLSSEISQRWHFLVLGRHWESDTTLYPIELRDNFSLLLKAWSHVVILHKGCGIYDETLLLSWLCVVPVTPSKQQVWISQHRAHQEALGGSFPVLEKQLLACLWNVRWPH